MKKMPDTLLVVDVEATCWERPGDQPPASKNEIIEIGIVPLSLIDLKIGEPKSILVKPIKSKVSKFCTRITTLTQEQVDTGISFREACEKLAKEMDSQSIPWVSWGDYDRKQFLWQCEDFKCPYPFGAGHWNFKDTFAKMMGFEHDLSLPIALKFMGLEFTGTCHRGADEANNIAKIMVESFRRLRGSYGKEIRREDDAAKETAKEEAAKENGS